MRGTGSGCCAAAAVTGGRSGPRASPQGSSRGACTGLSTRQFEAKSARSPLCPTCRTVTDSTSRSAAVLHTTIAPGLGFGTKRPPVGRALPGHIRSLSSERRRERLRSQPQVTVSLPTVDAGHGNQGTRPGLQTELKVSRASVLVAENPSGWSHACGRRHCERQCQAKVDSKQPPGPGRPQGDAGRIWPHSGAQGCLLVRIYEQHSARSAAICPGRRRDRNTLRICEKVGGSSPSERAQVNGPFRSLEWP